MSIHRDMKIMSNGPNGTWLTFLPFQAKEGIALTTSLSNDILKISGNPLGTILVMGWEYVHNEENPNNLRTNQTCSSRLKKMQQGQRVRGYMGLHQGPASVLLPAGVS